MQNSNTLTFLSLETSLQKLSYLLCYAFNNRSFTFFFSSSFFSCIGYFMWSNKLQISSVQPKASVLFYNCIFVQMICNFYVFKKCSLNLTPPMIHPLCGCMNYVLIGISVITLISLCCIGIIEPNF